MKFEVLNYDVDSKEADVLFSNDTVRFLCYADALDDINKVNVGAYVFSAFMASDIERAEAAFRIEKTEVSYYSHRLQGMFIGNGTMQIGEWIFLIDGYVPGDIQPGDFISFACLRIDFLEWSCNIYLEKCGDNL